MSVFIEPILTPERVSTVNLSAVLVVLIPLLNPIGVSEVNPVVVLVVFVEFFHISLLR